MKNQIEIINWFTFLSPSFICFFFLGGGGGCSGEEERRMWWVDKKEERCAMNVVIGILLKNSIATYAPIHSHQSKTVHISSLVYIESKR